MQLDNIMRNVCRAIRQIGIAEAIVIKRDIGGGGDKIMIMAPLLRWMITSSTNKMPKL